MKKILSLLLFVIVLCSFHIAPNLDQIANLHENCYVENKSFAGGEEVIYKVYYNWNFVWLPAGEVKFTVQESEGSYEITALGKTYPSYEWFFKVDDYYYSKLSKETLLPETFIRNISEGSYTQYNEIIFDQENQFCSSIMGKTEAEADLKEFSIEKCTHDLLSVIYYMRNIDFTILEKNSKIATRIFLDNETYPININFRGMKNNKWIKGLGYFDTFEISPELIEGNVFKEGDEMKIWVSNDENKVPLIIESPVSVGSVKVVLKSYDQLRHPLTSKK